jgi:hypothetical protein
VIAITLFAISDVRTDNYVTLSKEKEILDQCFNKAIDDAIFDLVEIDGMGNLIVNRERAISEFFNSMYATLGITDNLVKRELLNNYVPVIAVTGEDGYYLYFNEIIRGSDNYTFRKKRWTEKRPYFYEDDDFIYGFTMTDTLTIYDKKGLFNQEDGSVLTLDYHEISYNDIFADFRIKRPESFLLDENKFLTIRKQTIISCVENALSYYCNQYNNIAEQFGITYNFVLPVIDNSEWTRTIDRPCIIVLFQGYPYGSGETNVYNRFVISGASINREEVYYLEQKDWYFVYHTVGCEELKKEGIILMDEPCHTVTECASKGAYACPYCSDGKGVYAPDYTP